MATMGLTNNAFFGFRFRREEEAPLGLFRDWGVPG